MSNEEIQDILEELHLVRPEILQPKAKKLFEAIMSIADERDELKQENKQLKERPYYKFYRYENNPNGSDYCFCQRPCNSNMSLLCFLENGEILGFMSESLVYKHNEIKEVDLNEITHNFVKPLIKEKQHYKHIIDELERYLKGNIQELKNKPKDDSVITSDEVNDIVQCNLAFVLARLQELKGSDKE